MRKILNNDINELEAGIILWCSTKWLYQDEEKQNKIAINYLRWKYNLDDINFDEIINNWNREWIKYLNSLDENDILELLLFSKDLFINKFWIKHWSIAFSLFFGGLMEDNEHYTKIINTSIKINKVLLKEYNYIIKYFAKNHKYEIWKYISYIINNLWIKISNRSNMDIYNFWENYIPISE